MSPREAPAPSPRARVGYTPNFDGVLNNGDSWVARRRASEASLKSGTATRDTGGEQVLDGKAPEIREEEEDGNHELRKDNGNEPPSTPGESSSKAISDGIGFQDNNIRADMTQLSIDTYNQLSEPANNGPPPGIPDLASIEWSYKDPSGQIQGTYTVRALCTWRLTALCVS